MMGTQSAGNPDVVQGLDDPVLVPALEENTYGAYADFAAGPQGEVDATPEMVRYISGVPFPLFNGVARARLPSHELDARIAAILRPFAVRALPLFWWIGPSTQPADLGARLLAHGFVHEEDMPGMAVHLHALPQAPPSVPGLAVIPATTGEALGQWVQAGLRGFDFPPDLGPALLEMGTRQCRNRSGGMRVYAASGGGALNTVCGAWGSNDGDGAPVTTAAQALVR